MIYTVTFSPAIDYVMNINKLTIGEVNRSINEKFIIGGKGINVSILLHNIGIDSIALGFCGGFTGEYITRTLEKMGIKQNFVNIDGNTRINVKLKGDTETAINGEGPKISESDLIKFYISLSSINDGDYLIISGNAPSNISSNVYSSIFQIMSNKKVRIIIDSNKDLLRNTLCYHPFLIKPNLEELEELFNEKIDGEDALIDKCKKLQSMGAKNVIVSLGGNGAVMLTEDGDFFTQKGIKGTVISTVGAGDSLVAGFIGNYDKNNSYRKALEFGCACGSATAFSDYIATSEEIERVYKEIKHEDNGLTS